MIALLLVLGIIGAGGYCMFKIWTVDKLPLKLRFGWALACAWAVIANVLCVLLFQPVWWIICVSGATCSISVIAFIDSHYHDR